MSFCFTYICVNIQLLSTVIVYLVLFVWLCEFLLIAILFLMHSSLTIHGVFKEYLIKIGLISLEIKVYLY